MKQYVLDEIPRPDLARIKEYLDEKASPSGLEGIWWVELTPEQLSEPQLAHKDCQPHCFAVELGRNFVKFEFLIRSRRTMRCTCVGYATRVQRDWIMEYADRLVAELEVRT
ncbi:MAG: hypothetical protein FJ135_13000 [Deltaproteobacteria bacterium]|nr:hypothetical protein [Deltaproteobacteria bacterium]